MQHCCGHMLQLRVSLLICSTICFFPHYLNTCESVCWVIGWAWAVSKTTRDFQWGIDRDEQQPESSEGVGEKVTSQRRFLLFPSCSSPHEDVQRWKKKKKKHSSSGRRSKVFMLGLKHAKLMVGLFCLARETWYWEEMEEGRQRRAQDMSWKLSSPAKFHFFCSQSATQTSRKGESGGSYGKGCTHSFSHTVTQSLSNVAK